MYTSTTVHIMHTQKYTRISKYSSPSLFSLQVGHEESATARSPCIIETDVRRKKTISTVLHGTCSMQHMHILLFVYTIKGLVHIIGAYGAKGHTSNIVIRTHAQSLPDPLVDVSWRD